MDEEDGRLGPQPGHIIGNGAYFAKYGTRQQDGFQDPGELQRLMDVTGGRAQQLGRIDVLTDASKKSLRHQPNNKIVRVAPISCFWRHGRPMHAERPIQKTITHEVTYENVPGK